MLKFDEGWIADEEQIEEYFDRIEEKESEFTEIEYSVDAEKMRQRVLGLHHDNDSVAVINHQLFKELFVETDASFMDAFDDSTDPPIASGRAILDLIAGLRNAKSQVMSVEENPEFWDFYIETRLITLCKFAYDNGYGILFSN